MGKLGRRVGISGIGFRCVGVCFHQMTSVFQGALPDWLPHQQSLSFGIETPDSSGWHVEQPRSAVAACQPRVAGPHSRHGDQPAERSWLWSLRARSLRTRLARRRTRVRKSLHRSSMALPLPFTEEAGSMGSSLPARHRCMVAKAKAAERPHYHGPIDHIGKGRWQPPEVRPE